jgi:hypothetical protein
MPYISGQNKNRYTIGYFMWRVMTGQNEKIEYHMQVPGTDSRNLNYLDSFLTSSNWAI